MEALDKVGKIFSPPPADIYDRVNHTWMTLPRKIYLKVKHFYDNDTTYIYDRVNDCPMPVSWHNYCKVKHLYKDCKVDVSPRPGDDTLYVNIFDKVNECKMRVPFKTYQQVKHFYEPPDLSQKTIIFVCGGPGSGKGTQCERIVAKYGFTHLSSGDLLREAVASGSIFGKQLNALMQRGELVPMEMVLKLLKNAMVAKSLTSNGYLIDGYPRQVEQGVAFEADITPAKAVLYFEVSDEEMTKRLLVRGQTSGRVDDNEETIKSRLVTFHQATAPVTTHYHKQRKLHKINAERAPDAIFADVEKSLDKIILADCKVLFVVGGPGSGKGTQCQRLVNKFNLTHICSGDLLRDEVASGSKLGKSLALTMKKGDLVGLETVLTLIRNAMVKAALAGSDGFLIDGYPREVKQGAVFESMIKPCDGCVYFNCCDETMVERLLKRAQVDGVDDDEAKIRKRLAIFHNSTQPVVDHFKEKGKLIEVIAEGDVDEIYADGVVELAPVFDL